jgi:hypothetical protein
VHCLSSARALAAALAPDARCEDFRFAFAPAAAHAVWPAVLRLLDARAARADEEDAGGTRALLQLHAEAAALELPAAATFEKAFLLELRAALEEDEQLLQVQQQQRDLQEQEQVQEQQSPPAPAAAAPTAAVPTTTAAAPTAAPGSPRLAPATLSARRVAPMSHMHSAPTTDAPTTAAPTAALTAPTAAVPADSALLRQFSDAGNARAGACFDELLVRVARAQPTPRLLEAGALLGRFKQIPQLARRRNRHW